MCTVRVSKNFKKGARGVEERKSHRFVPWVPQQHHAGDTIHYNVQDLKGMNRIVLLSS